MLPSPFMRTTGMTARVPYCQLPGFLEARCSPHRTASKFGTAAANPAVTRHVVAPAILLNPSAAADAPHNGV